MTAPNVDPRPVDHCGPARILIVDADSSFRDDLAASLGQHGFDCDGVADSATALGCLENTDYDALIADVSANQRSEIAFIENLRAVGSLPVILLASEPSIKMAAWAVNRAAAYLTKPPVLAELLEVLHESIAAHRPVTYVEQSREALRQWDSKLENLSRALRKGVAFKREEMSPGDYLRVTLHCVLEQLAGVQKFFAGREGRSQGRSRSSRPEVVGALRHAIKVLEEEEQNVKSQRLADLRRQLIEVLDTVEK